MEKVWRLLAATLKQLDKPSEPGGQDAGPVAAPEALEEELLQWQHQDQVGLPRGSGLQPLGRQQCLKEFLEEGVFPMLREGSSSSSSNGAVPIRSHKNFCRVPLQMGQRPGQRLAADLCTLDW